jgi:hypothetical protein
MSIETVVATLLATLVGGLLSLLGSVYVARRESRRAAYIRLFDEYLPQFQPEKPQLVIGGYPDWRAVDFHPDTSGYMRFLPLMQRTARLAGRKTERLVNAVEDAVTPLRRELDGDEAGYVFEPVDLDEPDDEVFSRGVQEARVRLEEMRDEEFQRLCAARIELERHLEKKIGMKGRVQGRW